MMLSKTARRKDQNLPKTLSLYSWMHAPMLPGLFPSYKNITKIDLDPFVCVFAAPVTDLLTLYREADENCKRPMERLLNIWKERSLYRSDFIQQLKLAIEDSNSPRPSG